MNYFYFKTIGQFNNFLVYLCKKIKNKKKTNISKVKYFKDLLV